MIGKDAKIEDSITKLIIWDLDETLWTGTLAEKHTLIPKKGLIQIIRDSIDYGIVHSICSKNEKSSTMDYLTSLGIADMFLSPSIDFSPKGERIKSIIARLNLREENVLFIDDSAQNRHEAKHFCPRIETLDPNHERFEDDLSKIVAMSGRPGTSRMTYYRSLESRHNDQIASPLQSRESFLREANITLSFIRNTDNLRFAERIEDLINRTNQLNLMKTRVSPGSIKDYILNNGQNETISVVAWDKYGFHGLIGFLSIIRSTQTIEHFTFSCRVMDLGIEDATYSFGLKIYPGISKHGLSLSSTMPSWINVEELIDSKTYRSVLSKLDETLEKPPILRIMANCQSAAISHYIQADYPIEYDNYPRLFLLPQIGLNLHKRQAFPPHLVYGAFNDYSDHYWPDKDRGIIDKSLYKTYALRFISYLTEINIKELIVLLPPCAGTREDLGITIERITNFNSFWRDIAEHLSIIKPVELEYILDTEDIIDCRHYQQSGIMKISNYISRRIKIID